MKRTLVIALVAIAALYLALGQAIANNQAAGNTNVQEELKRLENDRAQAVLKGDTAALDRMTADDYTVIISPANSLRRRRSSKPLSPATSSTINWRITIFKCASTEIPLCSPVEPPKKASSRVRTSAVKPDLRECT